MNVFIIGITGQTGILIAKRLVQRGDRVSGLCRQPEQAAALRRLGSEAVIGDLLTLSNQALAAAVAGADVLIFSAGAGEQDAESLIDAIDGGGVRKAIVAARTAGVPRFLLVSVFPEAWRGADAPPSFEHYIKVKKQAEVNLVHSELDWLIVRPSTLTNDEGTGAVSLSPAEIHTSIPRDDVAVTITILLHTPAFGRRILEVTSGPTGIANAVNHLLEPVKAG